MSEVKKFKRRLKGTVVSAKSDKTIVVRVQRRFRHPVYSKYVNQSKKYHAHDEANTAKEGDVVTIIESKAHSKTRSGN
jgi:small subunit ribosomal protein S17